MKQGYQRTVAKTGNEYQDRETKPKQQSKSLQETHAEMLKNITSTNIGKPTIVEAQRILKILDTLYSNLTIFTYLDADFIVKFLDIQKGKLQKDIVNQLSPVCKDLLTHQAELETKFKPFASLLDSAQKGEEEIDEEKKKEADRLHTQLSDNFRQILRWLKENNSDFDIIKSLKPQTNQELNDLVHCIDCQRVIFLKKLSTAAEEEDSHKKQIKELNDRIDSLQGKKDMFEKELKKLKQEREKFSKEKKEELEKLKNEISDVKLDKKKKLEQLSKDQKSKEEALTKDHKQKEEKLNKEITELKTRFEKLKGDNQTDELQSKRKKINADNLLEENIRQYDSMMQEKMAEKQDLLNDLDKIQVDLKTLKEQFKEIDEERRREKELEEEFKKRKEEWLIQQRKKDEAIRHIQLAYKNFKQSSKKKKGKRGGKKK